MNRYTMLAVAVLSAAPMALEAQRPESAVERIQAAKARTAQAGIPLDLLERRIAEGRAKGVAEERIAAAVERREAALAMAQDAIGRSGRQIGGAGLSAGAYAAEAGVGASALHAVIQAARAGEEAVALAVLGELVRQGLPVGAAIERVSQALERRDGSLADLPVQAGAARERRGPPEEAGRLFGRGGRPGVGAAPRGIPPGIPAVGKRPGAGAPPGVGGKLGGRPGGKSGGRP